MKRAIPRSPSNTFTKSDGHFPPMIQKYKSTLKLSQYPTHKPINNQRMNKNKNKLKKDNLPQSEREKQLKNENRIKNIKRTRACVDYEIKQNGDFWDFRFEAIDLKDAAADLEEWPRINVCTIRSCCV